MHSISRSYTNCVESSAHLRLPCCNPYHKKRLISPNLKWHERYTIFVVSKNIATRNIYTFGLKVKPINPNNIQARDNILNTLFGSLK